MSEDDEKIAFVIPPDATVDEVVETAIDAFIAGGYQELQGEEAVVFINTDTMRVAPSVDGKWVVIQAVPMANRLGPVVIPPDEPEPPPLRRGVAKYNTNMRTGPSTSDSIRRTLPKGMEVVILEELDNGWFRIDADGLAGFVYAPLIQE